MCGIAGICRLTEDSPIPLDTLMRMTGILRHRGPDETGIYIDDRVGMGHARLSIIDLSSGLQPIANEDKTMWIVFNGEIFNYPELKDDLTARGHRFYTTSDTEVIIHLYEEYGAECLNMLNGQFAFAIWDCVKGELFIARDRVGIRPLHYTLHNGNLIFSSEIKSIFQVESIDRQLDPVALDQIFTFWTTLPSRTAFKNIHELPAGHYLKAKAGKIKIGRYWDIPYCPPEGRTKLSADEISQQALELLLDAVRIRLRADVPVGSYLSGGLDSSGLTSLVVNNFNKDVRTFGIRFQEDGFDEGSHQQEMVSFLNARHSEICASNESIGSAFGDVMWHGEKPLLRTSPIPLYLLSRLVRQSGIKVVLTGEGADEVFGGYNIFRETKVRKFWSSQPNSTARAALAGRLYPYIFKNPKLKNSLQNFFARGLDQTDDPLFSHMIRWDNTSRIKTFFSDDLKNQLGSINACQQLKESLPADYCSRDHLAKAQYLEMTIFMTGYLLSSQGDRVAMANSIEIRLPYLDPRILDFMAQVPPKWKILGLNEKHILKKSFKNILPENITARSKHPYRAPIARSLLQGQPAQYTREMLSEKSIKQIGLFDPKKVQKLLTKIETNGDAAEIESMALVGMLSSQTIHNKFVENFSTANSLPDSIDLLIDQRTPALQNKKNSQALPDYKEYNHGRI